MSADLAFQRLREVNPVPDPSSIRKGDLDAVRFLTSTQERSKDMKAIKPTEKERRQHARRRRGVVVALAVFATVILVGVGIWALPLGGSDGDVAADPESLLDDFIAAWEDQDVEGAVALFTADAEFDPEPGSPGVTGHEEMRALFAEAMPDFRFAEAYDLQRDGDLLTFNTRLMARDAADEECQRNELTVDSGKIGSWTVTVISFFPCP